MGEQVATCEIESPLGPLQLAASSSGLIRVGMPNGSAKGFEGWLRGQFPDAERVTTLVALDDAVDELRRYFDGGLHEFKVKLDLRGTAFQKLVWRQLAKIPFGETRISLVRFVSVVAPGTSKSRSKLTSSW